MGQWDLQGITDRYEEMAESDAPSEDGLDEPTIVRPRYPTVLWLTDTALRFSSFMQPEILDLGLAPEELEGESLLELFEEEPSSAEVFDAHMSALGDGPTQFEIWMADRSLRCWVSPLKNPYGRITGTICVAMEERIHLNAPTPAMRGDEGELTA